MCKLHNFYSEKRRVFFVRAGALVRINTVHVSDFSGASMYNFNDEEEDDDGPTKEKVEENEQLKEKMKQIRLKMEKINIGKKVGSAYRWVKRLV